MFLSFPYKTINLSEKRVPGKIFPFLTGLASFKLSYAKL